MQVVFGALAPPLSQQISGLPKMYDKDADSITRLVVRGIITEGEAHKARMRLLKRIERDVK